MRLHILLLFVTLFLLLSADGGAKAKEVTIRPSPTAPWIEVYHGGILTSEWQPADGAIYAVLELLIRDELVWPGMQREPLQVAWRMAVRDKLKGTTND